MEMVRFVRTTMHVSSVAMDRVLRFFSPGPTYIDAEPAFFSLYFSFSSIRTTDSAQPEVYVCISYAYPCGRIFRPAAVYACMQVQHIQRPVIPPVIVHPGSVTLILSLFRNTPE